MFPLSSLPTAESVLRDVPGSNVEVIFEGLGFPKCYNIVYLSPEGLNRFLKENYAIVKEIANSTHPLVL